MNEYEIYAAARELGEKNFRAAFNGLLEGQRVAMQELQEHCNKVDRAFLMALSLTEKGKRLDKDGIMSHAIAVGIDTVTGCEIEREFVNKNLKSKT